MTRNPLRRNVFRHAAFALAIAAATFVAPPGMAAGCDTVSSSGRWSIVDLPSGMSGAHTAIAFGRGGHDTLYSFSGSLGEGRTLARSTDGGCRWLDFLSLDPVGGGTETYRLDPGYHFLSVAVAQGTTSRPRAIYALAGDDGYGITLALPVVTLVSTDDGAHWTVHQPSPADLAGDYPRCAEDGLGSTRLIVGTDPSTVHLRCRTSGIVDGYDLAICGDAYYVSHDAGATWTAERPRLRDVAHATPDNGLGCTYVNDPRPSRVGAHQVWDYTWADKQPVRVVLSRDDSKTWAAFAQTSVAPPTRGSGFDVKEVGTRSGRPLVAAWDVDNVYLPGAAGALVKVPKPKPTIGRLANLSGAAFLQEKGRDRLLVAYDVEAPNASEAFLLDVATRTWTRAPMPPRRPDKAPAWTEFAAMPALTMPGFPTVYFATWDGLLVRYAA